MEYQERKAAVVLLADGTRFYGKSIGITGTSQGEICFNTGMTGYQEIFTDPSYHGQIMVTTNAHIGNYGAAAEDTQSSQLRIAGLICKNFSFDYSRPRASASLLEYFKEQNCVAIADVDTRALVSYIRENGAMNALITTEMDRLEALEAHLAKAPKMEGLELASAVSTAAPYFYGNPDAPFKVAALDLGIKTNILKHLAARDMYIQVFPYNTDFNTMEAWQPDGYFISNGPGDPEPLTEVQQTAKEIITSGKPTFGICLGHQIIALAHDIPTYKMFNGHRGINHPVINFNTGKGEITSQNHGFAVDRAAVEAHPELEITHEHLNDKTVAGIASKSKPCFSVQYHPEAGPGPNDATYLFDQFSELLKTTTK